MGTPTEGAPSGRSYTRGQLGAYFSHTRHDPVEELVSTLNSRYASTETLTETLRRCHEVDRDRKTTRDVWRAAAASPLATPCQLRAWIDEYEQREPAAANPALGAEAVAELWDATGERALLANPHMDPAVLTARAEVYGRDVAKNPAAPPEALEVCLRLYAPAVRQNPACPRELLDPVLAKRDAGSCYAIANPQLTLEELIALRDDELTRTGVGQQSFTLGTLERAIDQRTLATDPYQVRTLRADRHLDDVLAAVLLGPLDVIDPLMECLLAGGAPADATAALLATGFDGTVAELLDVAGALTDH